MRRRNSKEDRTGEHLRTLWRRIEREETKHFIRPPYLSSRNGRLNGLTDARPLRATESNGELLFETFMKGANGSSVRKNPTFYLEFSLSNIWNPFFKPKQIWSLNLGGKTIFTDWSPFSRRTNQLDQTSHRSKAWLPSWFFWSFGKLLLLSDLFRAKLLFTVSELFEKFTFWCDWKNIIYDNE